MDDRTCAWVPIIVRHKKLRLRGQYFVQSQRFWAASKPTAGQEPHVVNLGAMHIHLKSPDPMITAAACSGGSHWRQPTGVYICMRHAAANHRYGSQPAVTYVWDTRRRPITANGSGRSQPVYTYVRTRRGQSPLRQPFSVYICMRDAAADH